MITATDLEVRAGARTLLAVDGPRCGFSPATASVWSAATARARPRRCGSWPGRANPTQAP